MIVRQRLPMAVRVNVVPMRRRGMRGLGDTCTPTDCPNGPYAGYGTPAQSSASNYDYWLQQGMQSGVVPTPAEGTDPTLNTEAVTAAQNSCWASYADLQTATGWELCTGPDVAAQFACSQRNTQRAQQISDIQQQYNGQVPCSALSSIVPVVAPGPSSAPITSTTPATTPAATSTSTSTSTSASTSRGALSFVTSRGGSTLYPGDTWQITISGAAPNAPISVVGGMNGAMNNTPSGTTDANGNYTANGTIDSSSIGSWYEAWTVGGAGIGTITFTVAAAPATPNSASTTGSTTTGGSTTGGTTTGGTTTSTTDNWFTDQMISGVPNWALVAAAAAVAMFAFRGKNG